VCGRVMIPTLLTARTAVGRQRIVSTNKVRWTRSRIGAQRKASSVTQFKYKMLTGPRPGAGALEVCLVALCHHMGVRCDPCGIGRLITVTWQPRRINPRQCRGMAVSKYEVLRVLGVLARLVKDFEWQEPCSLQLQWSRRLRLPRVPVHITFPWADARTAANIASETHRRGPVCTYTP
jgi:hypothetical protein